VLSEHVHGVGSNQFLSVNIGVIRLLSVITTPLFAPTTKALFKFFMILKKTRITMEFGDKVDSIKYSTVP
jgi:hypothetical protein